MTAPLVSAIVPVFNRQATVGEAVASLAQQTLSDLEIIIVDDGSTDASAEIAKRAGGKLARVLQHSVNRGIPAARNTGLEAARGKFIAWLDSDDLARPQRLERQLRFLARHSDVAVLGSASGRIGPEGQRKRRVRVPFRRHETLAAALLFGSPFQQSSIMGAARVLKQFEYRAEFPVCEDLDMFIRISRKHRLANLKDVLIDRRLHAGQIGRLESAMVRDRKRVLFRHSLEELGLSPSKEELDRHITLGRPKKLQQTTEFLLWAEGWLKSLRARNERACVYDPQSLALICARSWLVACRLAMHGNQRAAATRAMLTSSLMLGLANTYSIEWLTQLVSPLLTMP
jgi:glycosyltransferase involved in cell wall biosynthesis